MPMKSHRIPYLPWERVSMDALEYKGQKFMVMVDSYSDFFEVKKMRDTTAQAVIEFCKENFARYGIPQVLVSDNAPQFVGSEFTGFARQWEFIHSTSSPMHSQGNGKAEAAVKIVKKLLKKCARDEIDFHAALLEWRNVPTADMDSSPSQRLMARRTRTTLPIAQNLLVPEVVPCVHDSLEYKRKKTKMVQDRGSKSLPDLEIGSEVLVKPTGHQVEAWAPGRITDKHNESSYDVTIDGRILRRSRTWIKPTYDFPNHELQERAMSDAAKGGTLLQLPVPGLKSPTKEASSPRKSLPRTSLLQTSPPGTGGSPQAPVNPQTKYQGSGQDRPKAKTNSSQTTTTRSGRLIKPPTKYE